MTTSSCAPGAAPAPPRPQRRSAGQILVEFTLLVPMFLLILAGCIDYALYNENLGQLITASRQAGRYAATHPTAWSNAASPPATTSIEGYLVNDSGVTPPANDDAHITIKYLIPSATATATQCGHYSAATNAFVADNSYTQATCVIPGTLISISATTTYRVFFPLLARFGATFSQTATEVIREEV